MQKSQNYQKKLKRSWKIGKQETKNAKENEDRKKKACAQK